MLCCSFCLIDLNIGISPTKTRECRNIAQFALVITGVHGRADAWMEQPAGF